MQRGYEKGKTNKAKLFVSVIQCDRKLLYVDSKSTPKVKKSEYISRDAASLFDYPSFQLFNVEPLRCVNESFKIDPQPVITGAQAIEWVHLVRSIYGKVLIQWWCTVLLENEIAISKIFHFF